jgi:predicted MFS family arabinose efflux permease
MTYLEELRANWRPLAGATIGLSSGFTALAFTNSIMGPHLIRAFGWSQADFALLGTAGMIGLIALPVAGRLVDSLGVRRTASIGFIAGPLSFLVMSQMSGNFAMYMALVLIQNLLCMTTTATVFTRAVVEHTRAARGMALAIVASGPALAIAVLGPMLNNYVAEQGWRSGFIALAIYIAVGGVLAISLVPPSRSKPALHAPKPKTTKEAYRSLATMPTFWIMLAAIIMSNISQFMTNSQLGVVLQAYDASTKQISGMISMFAIGVLVGRFACGLALDRLPAPFVAVLVMAIPPIGQFLIAADLHSPAALSAAVLLLGLSYGGEGDLISYLVARSFGIEIFGTVMGIMVAAITLGSTGGAFLLRLTLQQTGSYGTFLVVSGIIALFGSLLFLLLPKPDQAKIDSLSNQPSGIETA